jgi:hypothetical protein
VLAMLLAFSAKPEELDILMLSLTFGNVEVQKYVLWLFRPFLLFNPALVTRRFPCIPHSNNILE